MFLPRCSFRPFAPFWKFGYPQRWHWLVFRHLHTTNVQMLMECRAGTIHITATVVCIVYFVIVTHVRSQKHQKHICFSYLFIFLPFSNRSSILIKTLIKNQNLHRTRPCISSLVPVCCKVLESSSQGQAFPSTLYVSLQQFWEKHVGVCCYCIM